MEIRVFTMEDHEAAKGLWLTTPGMGLSRADEAEPFSRFLKRNPGLSFVAVDDDQALRGTVLAGHDGRRGFLYHLAVHPDCRGQGIGKRLVDTAMAALQQEQIAKCHIMVLMDNVSGQAFWAKLGWELRDYLYVYSRDVKENTAE